MDDENADGQSIENEPPSSDVDSNRSAIERMNAEVNTLAGSFVTSYYLLLLLFF